MATVLFKDLGKSGRDLLSKDFSGDKASQTVEWKGKSDGGVSVTAKVDKNAKGESSGSLTFEKKFEEYHATAKTEVTTGHQCKPELKFTDAGVDGLNVTVSADAKQDSVAAAVAADFQNDVVGFDFKAAFGAEPLKFATGLVLASNNFTVGVNVADANTSGDFKAANGQVGYAAGDFEAGLGVVAEPSDGETAFTINCSYFQKLSGDWKVGAQGSFPRGGDDSASFTLGTEWGAQGTTYKARVGTDGTVALALKQAYNENVTFSVGTSTDTATATSKFGFSLNLSS